MGNAPHYSPKIRAYGKARIEITRRARDEAEWRRLWKEPSKPYPFTHAPDWKFNPAYKVDDFAAEVGFFIDLLGFPVWAFSPSYAQFTSPNGEFSFSVYATQEGEESTPAHALRLQFNLLELAKAVHELQQRGVIFDQPPTPIQEGSGTCIAIFRTPHGVPIDLFGELTPEEQVADTQDLAESMPDQDDPLPLEETDVQPKPQRGFGEQIDEALTGDTRSDSQSTLWQTISRMAARGSAPSIHAQRPNQGNRGNGELTYAPLEGEEFDQEDEEEFP